MESKLSGLTDDVLEEEFRHARGITYLDHAGAALYSCKQLRDHVADLASNLYSNPHSGSPSSKETTAIIENVREIVLRHFNTSLENYDIVFTAGCTAALNLLSNAFPWQPEKCPTSDVQIVSCDDGRGVANISLLDSTESSVFCYLDDNHTSVVGMREVARASGARTHCVSSTDLRTGSRCPQKEGGCHTIHHLFAYPAQSNFSGHKYPLSWCQDIPEERVTIGDYDKGCGVWKVVLDAASYVSSSPLDLSRYTPDFVVISFYKIFGFPTGLGALVVRRDNEHLLNKAYYGGGTVRATDSWTNFHVGKETLHDRLEDGTLPFLDILALRHGFAMLHRLGGSMKDVQHHTFQIARLAYKGLSSLTHSNGRKVCILYSHTDFEDPQTQGPIVNFNVVQPNGELVGYSQVEQLAAVFDVHLRTGCFCNTGACMAFLGIDSRQLQYNLKRGHECGDALDLIDGRPTGSVRISVGLSSTVGDVDKFLHFIKSNFVEGDAQIKGEAHAEGMAQVKSDTQIKDRAPDLQHHQLLPPPPPGPSHAPPTIKSVLRCGMMVQPQTSEFIASIGHSPLSIPTREPCSSSTLHLHSITVYPIKSCTGFKVQQWPLGEKGLLYDREWMLVGETGSVLTQKQVPRLCLVHPVIDLHKNTLTLTSPGHVGPCCLPISTIAALSGEQNPASISTRVCGDRVRSIGCAQPVSDWLSQVIGRSCRLVRQSPDGQRRGRSSSHEGGGPLLSLANEGQYLMVSLGSLEQLLHRIQERDQECGLQSTEDLAKRFRANLVIGGQPLNPFVEENWTAIEMDGHIFQVVGPCTRCQMVCVDPQTGGRGSEPLRSLVAQRGSKASFGIYLSLDGIHDVQHTP